VLIELGYVSNKQDLKLMTSDAWRARTSDALAQAVNTFFSTRLAGSGPARGACAQGFVITNVCRNYTTR
jgi:N-acetylmuramoyl-L-alanine amidase